MTPTQKRYAEAFARTGTIRGAARECGVAHSTVRGALRKFRKTEQDSSTPPGKLGAPGFYAHTISTTGDGKESIKWRRDELVPEAIPDALVIKKVSQLIDGEGRELLRWNQFKQEDLDLVAAFKDAARKHSQEYRGLASAIARPTTTPMSDLMTVICIGDAHCGMFAHGPESGKDFDLKIWQAQLQRAIDLVISQSPRTDRCTIFNAGDWYHVQNSGFTTPASGHRLDADSRLHKIVRVGVDAMRWTIDRALQHFHHVSVRNTRGNHDTDISMMFNMWLQDLYANEPRVSVPDNFAFAHYERFGSNLLGYTHGDGPKPEELPGIMATDCRDMWSSVKHCMWLTCHIHHKKVVKLKEYPGVAIESFRTMAPRDAWHSQRGYRSEQGIESLVFDRKYGLKSRTYVRIDEVEEV